MRVLIHRGRLLTVMAQRIEVLFVSERKCSSAQEPSWAWRAGAQLLSLSSWELCDLGQVTTPASFLSSVKPECSVPSPLHGMAAGINRDDASESTWSVPRTWSAAGAFVIRGHLGFNDTCSVMSYPLLRFPLLIHTFSWG